MGSAICLSADRKRALRETPAALSLLVSLSATEDLSRLIPIIILALILALSWDSRQSPEMLKIKIKIKSGKNASL
jgi:hypothetical protein